MKKTWTKNSYTIFFLGFFFLSKVFLCHEWMNDMTWHDLRESNHYIFLLKLKTKNINLKFKSCLNKKKSNTFWFVSNAVFHPINFNKFSWKKIVSVWDRPHRVQLGVVTAFRLEWFQFLCKNRFLWTVRCFKKKKKVQKKILTLFSVNALREHLI